MQAIIVPVILAFLFLASCAASPATELTPVASHGIQLISEQRTKAETQIALLAGLLHDKDISDREFGTGKTLYSEAQGAFNGWIDRIIFDIGQDKTMAFSKEYQITLDHAVQRADEFFRYVQKLFLGEKQGGTVDSLVSVFLKPVTDAGISIWHEVRDFQRDREVRKDKIESEIASQLRMLKWRDFDAVRSRESESHVNK